MHYKYSCTPNVECANCGTPFYKLPSRILATNSCSMACRSAHNRVDHACESCGKVFSVMACIARKHQGRFCSVPCRAAGIKSGKVSNRKLTMPPFEHRFWSRVVKSACDDGCWLWDGDSAEYGRIKRNGKTVAAHRASWEMANGPIADGLMVCHECDTPGCVNPAHLFLGTAMDNRSDCVSKDRHVQGVDHYKAKLTPQMAQEIRAKYVKRYGAIAELAREYGVSSSAIQSVIAGKSWKHV